MIRLVESKTLSELCRQTPPKSTPASPRVPLVFLVSLAQVADDLQFLGRVFSHCRQLTSDAIRSRVVYNPGGRYEWTVACKLEGQPDVSCRLQVSKRVDWIHALRTVYPQDLLNFRNAPGPKPPIDVHSLLCSFSQA